MALVALRLLARVPLTELAGCSSVTSISSDNARKQNTLVSVISQEILMSSTVDQARETRRGAGNEPWVGPTSAAASPTHPPPALVLFFLASSSWWRAMIASDAFAADVRLDLRMLLIVSEGKGVGASEGGVLSRSGLRLRCR